MMVLVCWWCVPIEMISGMDEVRISFSSGSTSTRWRCHWSLWILRVGPVLGALRDRADERSCNVPYVRSCSWLSSRKVDVLSDDRSS